MKDILVVTGTCGVGKSSVCWAWANRRRGAVIECDVMRTWIRDEVVLRAEGFQEMFLARHACALAEDYLAMGLDVAIDNVWFPRGLDVLRERLSGRGRLVVFRLCCGSEENHRRDGRRSPSDVMGDRVDSLRDELEAVDWPDYVVDLDTSGQTLPETIERIEAHFGGV